jgi:hypothetical protein
MRVTVRDRDRMSLPGLLAAGILERRLGGDAKVALRGDVLLDVAGAQVTVRFGDGTIEITREAPVEPIAELHGGYMALVDLASGRPLRSFRSGMRVRGKPGVLLVLLPLFRALA